MLVEGFLAEMLDEIAVDGARDIVIKRIGSWLRESVAADEREEKR